MEELQRLQASRRGHRGHLTKLFKRSEDILAKQNSITELDLASANTTLDNLKKKGKKLRELDGEIAPKIIKPEDLKQEIIDEEEIQEEIAEICAKQSVIVKNGVISVPTVATTGSSPAQYTPSTISTNSNTSAATQNTSPVNSTVNLITSTPTVMPSLTQSNISLSTSSVTFQPPQSQTPIATNTTNSCSSRLPKLSLPVFSGDSLEWLSFWDSFDVGVHRKPGLPDVDKFNYLRAQVSGEAERAIGGYPITGENYARAIATLKERFGQTHKITNAHMSALLELPCPSNTRDSLRHGNKYQSS